MRYHDPRDGSPGSSAGEPDAGVRDRPGREPVGALTDAAPVTSAAVRFATGRSRIVGQSTDPVDDEAAHRFRLPAPQAASPRGRDGCSWRCTPENAADDPQGRTPMTRRSRFTSSRPQAAPSSRSGGIPLREQVGRPTPPAQRWRRRPASALSRLSDELVQRDPSAHRHRSRRLSARWSRDMNRSRTSDRRGMHGETDRHHRSRDSARG